MSFPSLPGVPDDEQPMYVRLSQSASRVRTEYEATPSWRLLKRRKLRNLERTLSLASAYSHMGRWS